MPTTVILGAGIIGLSSAHSLAALAPADHNIHLVEPAPDLFASASAKAAGFVAKDWFAPASAPLGLLSFALHRELAERHNGRARWGYSESVSYSLDHAYRTDDGSPDAHAEPAQEGNTGQDVAGASESGSATGLDWLLSGTSRATVAPSDDGADSSAGSYSKLPEWLLAQPEALNAISDRTSTAQVHPQRLCEFLLEQCLAAGVTLHHPARATALLRDEEDPDGLTRVRVEYSGSGEEGPEGRARTVNIPCESIVIAAGCWTHQVYATLFPNASRMPRISHLAGYAVTLKSKRWPPVQAPSAPNALRVIGGAKGPPHTATATSDSSVHTHAIFTDVPGFAPEIFSRITGDVWLGGLNTSAIPLPALPTDAQIDAAEVERLLAVAHRLCGADVEVRGSSLCFRPVSATGRPIIARMHEADLGDGLKPAGLDGKGGVFVATGHGPWGISLSLGTGRVVAEMVLGRETSADVGALSRW
ncbi:nucleotide-binding domain-containing protein [Fomes fomentarius]|nr:nucleotide-binding domain-containing protein [Fomes fomentarius]